MDKNGKELWHLDTRIDTLEGDKFYHGGFQRSNWTGESPLKRLPVIEILDINGDQRKETLFSLQTADDLNGGLLFCYNDQGQELWQFRSGKPIRYGSSFRPNDYRIKGFEAYDVNGDGFKEIIVISIHRPDWPTQLALLSTQGELIGEYWNSGHLNDYVFHDLDGDSKPELIIAGTNNEYQKGCLIVLNPADISGGSPQTKYEFASSDLERGSELYYVLFPRTDVDQISFHNESLARIYLTSDETISAWTYGTDIDFILDYSLSLKNIILSHKFHQMHLEAFQAGRIQSILGDDYIEQLKNKILYFNGKQWTATPSRNCPDAH